jgi:DNA repair protein RecO (recombination protein O)
MLVKTEAILINKIKYSDNSIIVSLFTSELGKISAIVRLSHKSKSNLKPALFFHLNIITTEINFKNTIEVQNLKYCESNYILADLCSDINKIEISLFIAEILFKTIREQSPNQNLFEFLKNYILQLNETKNNVSNFHLNFLRDFADLEGFKIYNNFSKEVPYFNFIEGMFFPIFFSDEESLDYQHSELLHNFLKSNSTENPIKINYQHRKELINIFMKYYQNHFAGFKELKTLKVLEDLFS